MEARETRPVSGFPIPSLQGAERLACTLLVLCTAWFLLACHKPEADSTEPKDSGGNVLRFDVYGSIGSLDPVAAAAGAQIMIQPFLYSYLCIENEDHQLEPGLATAWEYDPNTFTWTIHLRAGVRFHDSRPVTSHDVRYSLETQLRNLATPVFRQIDRLLDESESTLRMILKSDDPDFLRKVFAVEIVPQPVAGTCDLPRAPVGSGPFKFSYRIGDQEVGLVANEDFYLGRPALDGLIVRFEPDKEKSWARLLSGKTDLMLGMNSEDYEMIRNCEDRFHLSSVIEPFTTALVFNTADPLFVNAKIRLALALAIDKNQIRKNLLNGLCVACAGTMGYHSPFRNRELEPIPYDPTRSMELLREVGWSLDQEGRSLWKNGRPFEFNILYLKDMPLHGMLGQQIRFFLNDLGIKARLESVSYDEAARRYWKNTAFQAVLVELPDVRDNPYTLQRLWCSVDGGKAGVGAFDDPGIAGLIGNAIQQSDDERRERMLNEVDFMLNQLQPAIFLYQRTSLNVLSKRFRMPYPFSSIYARFHLWRISLMSK